MNKKLIDDITGLLIEYSIVECYIDDKLHVNIKNASDLDEANKMFDILVSDNPDIISFNKGRYMR